MALTGCAYISKFFTSLLEALISMSYYMLYLLPVNVGRLIFAGEDVVEARLTAQHNSLEKLTKQAVAQVKEKCEQKYKGTIESVQWELNISQHAVIGGDRHEATSLVLLLHGFPECWHSWHEVLPQLVNKGHFVVAPDMRGYGLTESPLDAGEYTTPKVADDFRALIKHVRQEIAPKIRTVTVVGHDYGGAPANELALTEPDVIDRCVLVNVPHAKVLSGGKMLKRAPWQIFNFWYFLMFQVPGLAEKMFGASNWSSKVNPGLSEFSQKLLVASHAKNLTQMLSYHRTLTINLSSVSHRVRSLCKYGPFSPKAYAPAGKLHVLTRARSDAMRVPLMQIWGTGDRIMDVAFAEVLEEDAARFAPKGCEVVYLEGVTHFVPTEAPTELASHVHRFIWDGGLSTAVTTTR